MTRISGTIAPSVVLGGTSANPSDPRLCNQLRPVDAERIDVALLGVPFDQGITMGGGRPGAAEGPTAFRRALRRFGTTYDLELDVDLGALRLADAGDVAVVPDDVGATHDRVTTAASAAFEQAHTVVVVGGGNDASFATVRALAERGAVGGVNVDAHFDVREVVRGRLTSGTPFRRVLTELGVPGARFAELGAHPAVNARAHRQWLGEQGATVVPLGALRQRGPGAVLASELARLEAASEALFVSIDLDVLAACYAPGVSAPGTVGLTPEEARELAIEAGRSPRVRLFELMELSPPNDLDDRTARLAVMLFASFLAGRAERRTRP